MIVNPLRQTQERVDAFSARARDSNDGVADPSTTGA
ncbi:hypothetical protein AAULR_13287 [Lacticaseibacillus rhamnosus MTCC 5462]|nr:hypothetical protein AAULR_13287 [Lacticaseibacillus rhamnosus MTCC 5462]